MPSKFISRRDYLEKENFKGRFLTVAPLFHNLFTSLAPRSAPQDKRFEPFWTLLISRSLALIVPAIGILKSLLLTLKTDSRTRLFCVFNMKTVNITFSRFSFMTNICYQIILSVRMGILYCRIWDQILCHVHPPENKPTVVKILL